MNDRALWPADLVRAVVRAADSIAAAADAVSAAAPALQYLPWAVGALAVALLVLAFRR